MGQLSMVRSLETMKWAQILAPRTLLEWLLEFVEIYSFIYFNGYAIIQGSVQIKYAMQ